MHRLPKLHSCMAHAPHCSSCACSALLQAWLRYTRWAMAAYDDLKDTPSGLATKLGIQVRKCDKGSIRRKARPLFGTPHLLPKGHL